MGDLILGRREIGPLALSYLVNKACTQRNKNKNKMQSRELATMRIVKIHVGLYNISR